MKPIDARAGRIIRLLTAFIFFALFLGLSTYYMSRASDVISKQRETYKKLKAER